MALSLTSTAVGPTVYHCQQDAIEKRVEKVLDNKKWTVSALKDLCQLLGLEKGGDRESLVRRAFDFLKAPSAAVSEWMRPYLSLSS